MFVLPDITNCCIDVWKKFELFFVYAEDIGDTTSLANWSSLDLLTEEDLDATSPTVVIDKQGQFL
jgi:hypothetical protein